MHCMYTRGRLLLDHQTASPNRSDPVGPARSIPGNNGAMGMDTGPDDTNQPVTVGPPPRRSYNAPEGNAAIDAFTDEVERGLGHRQSGLLLETWDLRLWLGNGPKARVPLA